ncbi:S1 family peptidase [Planktothrix paucivesiculata]|uniref:Serine protease n=1 Tax=Planktothrix paucivesiculata PCC 9631 TaxID=671071 RepID=A0A7Z9BI36_9CYAN|nr:serine protease [Planktothrix paucivesiculata]VXD14359.1 conserved hypothetical protein [Planktothrix paucivesiculata PCC 9631]
MSLTDAEKLMHTTVRLECLLASGDVSTGTGFFFRFRIDDQTHIPVIVTNKHVIKGSVKGTFVLTKVDTNDQPIIGAYEKIEIDDFENKWIKHPETDVDLAIFAIAPLLLHAEANKIRFFTPSLEESHIPSKQQLNDLSGLEDITMIGYPNGIWDEKNNMPIIRKGITATSPKYNYNGLPVFVIDCACFPGSSGSPVLVFNQGGYTDARGNTYMGVRNEKPIR